jgi:hypothetical protein
MYFVRTPGVEASQCCASPGEILPVESYKGLEIGISRALRRA